MIRIIQETEKVMRAEPNIVYITLDDGADHFNILGDTHGQYADTLSVFKANGFPSAARPYIFNGDYVDRGSYGVENMLLLFVLKLLNPKYLHLNRGNHETFDMNMAGGFFGEIKAKFGAVHEVIKSKFTDVFCSLPLGCVALNKVFIIHGGLFPDVCT